MNPIASAVGAHRPSLTFAQQREQLRERGTLLGLAPQRIERIFLEVDTEALGRACGTPIWRNQEARLRIDRAARETAR